jgi:hypothetical protein
MRTPHPLSAAPHGPSRFLILGFLLGALLCAAPVLPQDAALQDGAAFSLSDSLEADAGLDSGARAEDTAAVAAPAAAPPETAPIPPPPSDSFDVGSCTIVGAGAGVSLGGMPVYALWQKGLPGSLAGIGLTERFMPLPGDSSALVFSVKERPAVYNMTFPVFLLFGRLSPERRYGLAASFSVLAKDFAATVFAAADSTNRRIDIRQRFTTWAAAFEFLYGRTIPQRYFSVDGVDRTDCVIGISTAPFIALNKTTDLGSPAAPDARFSAVRDSIWGRMGAFSAAGIAVAWRAGIVSLRRVSKHGGIEAGVSYYGLWAARFSTAGGTLSRKEVSAACPERTKPVSAFSNRIEITAAMVRRTR